MSEHDEGYYDGHPLLMLPKPLALVGLIAAETRSVGYRFASLWGLPFIDTDRRIEHRAGRTLWELVAASGPARLRQLERSEVLAALGERPAAVIALGDGALLDAAVRREVEARSRLVALSYELSDCCERLRSSGPPAGPSWHPLASEPLPSLDEVAAFRDERLPGFAGAEVLIPMAGRSAEALASSLASELDLVS